MPGEPPDRELLARARAGELDAFASLVRRHAPVAARVASAIAGHADADDVLQEAFVRAHRALGTVRDGAEVRPWLLAIVANQARNHRRAANRRATLHLRLAARADTSVAGEDPTSAAERDERRRLLLAAVQALPERDRLVVACRYLLELSEAETAAVTGWPIGTVKSRLSRGLRRLHTALPGALTGDGPALSGEVSDG